MDDNQKIIYSDSYIRGKEFLDKKETEKLFNALYGKTKEEKNESIDNR